MPKGPAGEIPDSESFSYHWSDVKAKKFPGGEAKIVDTRTFPVANTVVAQFVKVEPGALRYVPV